MVQLLSYVWIILAILLIALVLIQRANTDASGAFGADGGSSTAYKKRGAEKTLHQMTVIVSVLFVVSLASTIFIS